MTDTAPPDPYVDLIDLVQSKDGSWLWHAKAASGEVLYSSQRYMADAVHNALFRDDWLNATRQSLANAERAVHEHVSRDLRHSPRVRHIPLPS